MATLQSYITQCRRLLHDANANFYSDQELIDYVNEGRERLVRDTGCLRTIQMSATVIQQEVYNFIDLPQGIQTLDIVNINVYWGSTRVPLRYLAWTNFNTQLRYWTNYTRTPVAFSVYGQSSFYLGPVPDQVYTLEIDTVVLPVPLVNLGDIDTIMSPFTSPVAFYACYKAKFQEESFGESDIFQKQYINQARAVLASIQTRRMPTPYTMPY